ncbi:MAG: phosphotransferase, partial [Pseudomonadales bacterium]|nr:phosphotransferase [Pseudomonadales bacterium]
MNSPEAVLAAGWFVARDVAPLGAGHIHDTFRATDARGARFVLQRINDRVFADPVQVMHNVMRVTAHTSAHAPGLTPVLVRSRSGDGFHTDERGRVWRLWEEVGDCRVVSQVTQTALAEAAGFAFGRFQQVLADLPQPPLAPVIPGFHELEKVLLRFDH